jgi:hypothetical protein
MERMRIKTRELDHPKMTGRTDTATRGDDPTITTTTTLTAKQPQGIKRTTIKEMTAETVGITMTTEMTRVVTGSSGQGVQESTINR